MENAKYVGVITRVAEYDPHVPLCIEILYCNENQQYIRLEKWVFHYDKKTIEGNTTARSNPSLLTKKIGLLLRTLYCFIRLLPSYYIILSSNTKLFYRISHTNTSNVPPIPTDNFEDQTLTYAFPVVPMTIGNITIDVSYINPNTLSSIAKTASTPTRNIPSKSNSNSTVPQQSHGRRHSLGAHSNSAPVPEERQNYQQMSSSQSVQYRSELAQTQPHLQSGSLGGGSSAIPIPIQEEYDTRLRSKPQSHYSSSVPTNHNSRYGHQHQSASPSAGGGLIQNRPPIAPASAASSLSHSRRGSGSIYEQNSSSNGATMVAGDNVAGLISASLGSSLPKSGGDSNSQKTKTGLIHQYMGNQGPTQGPNLGHDRGYSPQSQNMPFAKYADAQSYLKQLVRDVTRSPNQDNPNTNTELNANSESNAISGRMDAYWSILNPPIEANPVGPGNIPNNSLSFGSSSSLQKPSPPFQQVSPTLVSGSHRASFLHQQIPHLNSNGITNFNGNSIGNIPLVDQLTMKRQVLFNTCLDEYVVQPIDMNASVPGMTPSPFDNPNPVNGSVYGAPNQTNDATPGAENDPISDAATVKPEEIEPNRKLEYPDSDEYSDSSDSEDSDDMPFAWVPDGAPVEKSPPRKSRKSPETSSRNENCGHIMGSNLQCPGDHNDISLARQCAQPPTLVSFQHINKYHESRQLMLNDENGKNLLSVIGAQFNALRSPSVADQQE